MKILHRTLDRLLQTSNTRFNEIRDNLNKGLKQYLVKKAGGSDGANNISDDEDDDDDVEILPNPEENDDPIFIDENSVDSNANDTNSIDQQEVDLTGAMSSGELTESVEKADMNNILKDNDELQDKSNEQDDTIPKAPEEDPLANDDMDQSNENNNDESEATDENIEHENQSSDHNEGNKVLTKIHIDNKISENKSNNEKETSESKPLNHMG